MQTAHVYYIVDTYIDEKKRIVKIEQIKIDFYVTPKIKRYVYVYLLIGEKCFLIDSGVAGCQDIILQKMKEYGKGLQDLAGI